MRIKLADLFDPADLWKARDDGYVRMQTHPTLPLVVFNYTEKAAYERAWNDITRQCRGLIVNQVTQEIVARPFDKFFNLGEEKADESYWDSPATVTDKLDGSLGILFPVDDFRWAIATRGSFTSDQAIHASLKLQGYLANGFVPDRNLTYLFEIVYPANRIVLDYGDWDDLILLGARDTQYGYTMGPSSEMLSNWPGPRARVAQYTTMREAFEAAPRENAEGYVVHLRESDRRVKIKQEDYVRLHRIITGMNERTVWQLLSTGTTEAGICSDVPEEFWPWISDVCAKIFLAYADIDLKARTLFGAILRELREEQGTNWARRDFALKAQRQDNPALLFRLLDGKDTSAMIWRMIRPEAGRPLVIQGEDTA